MKAPPTWLGNPRVAGVLIVVVGILVYMNSFTGPFILDDEGHIPDNPHIRSLWPPWKTMTPGQGESVRPLLRLSLAVNYAIHGLDVRGYHVTNLVIHLLAGLVLFGIVRRTLAGDALRDRFDRVATPLALVAAALWTVHPLQTESVTYIIQRGESMMGLFYLLTLYCVIRGTGAARRRRWYAAAVAACAAAMVTKEPAVTLPVMVLLYDRVFLGGSFRKALGRRAWLYTALAATWLLPGTLILSTPPSATAGFHLEGLSPLNYALTQCHVVLRYYLTLSVWPHPLVLDYGSLIVQPSLLAMVPVTLTGLLLLGTVLLLCYRPTLGFLGAWFFVILAPTSSFLPIADTVVEHRMYLSLAAVMVLLVVAGYLLGRRLLLREGPGTPNAGWTVGLGLAVAAVAVLGYMTHQRNKDYRSALSIWRDTVAKVPLHWRPRLNLGVALSGAGRDAEAIVQYREALRLRPGQPKVRRNLGVVLTRQGKLAEAISLFEEALRSDPEDVEAHSNLGAALTLQGKLPEAIAQFQQVLRLAPRHVGARNNLGAALARQGRFWKTLVHYSEALRVDPGNRTAHRNIFRLLVGSRNAGDALKRYRTALRLGIEEPYVLNGLARLLATCPDARIRNGPEAVRLAKRACELTRYGVPRTLDTLAAAHAETGDFAEAVRVAENALEIALGSGQDRMVEIIRGHLALYRSQRPCREGPGATKLSHPEGMR